MASPAVATRAGEHTHGIVIGDDTATDSLAKAQSRMLIHGRPDATGNADIGANAT